MRFDFTDLRLFLAVAEAGSITHGAAEAGLSLPAASERLREMEASSRLRLLDRGRRGVTLTEAGEALLHHARLVLSQMARMHGEMGQLAKAVRGTVRVFANTAAVAEFLPLRLAPWLATHPHADIVVKERQSADVARGIALGFAEIGVLSDLVDTTGLTLRPFVTDRLVVVAARDHSLAAMRQVRLADLRGQPFIGLTEGALQDHLNAQAARIGLRTRPRIQLRGFDDICRMASAGVGVGIVPETAARRCRKSMPISVKRLSDDWAVRRLSLCTRSDTKLTPLAQSLIRHLESERKGPPGRAHTDTSTRDDH
ncbi:LysR family transcriptional regulator [Rhizobium sp. BK068]|uniref:LysR family transcriptional regulator n=1 Tax=Rhizobium sp. BK068 TaxID=2512130 RepID=UPI00104E8190|nr:LysR family transcriptional regulator [Rhizobium sp. BK068]TCM71247.1 DNA-binding transcriptional LysR family regulator [Rhizobium sp. BK068]